VLDQNGIAHQSAVLQMVGLHPDPAQRGRAQTIEASEAAGAPAAYAPVDAEASANE
jgi:hypothetical protein